MTNQEMMKAVKGYVSQAVMRIYIPRLRDAADGSYTDEQIVEYVQVLSGHGWSNHPYMLESLCHLMKGAPNKAAKQAIRELANYAYKHVDTRH